MHRNQLGQDILADAGYDGSGTSVSLSGDGRIVALGESGYGDYYVGFVRVYEYNINTNTWNQVGDDIYGESISDESGSAVSLSNDGKIVAIGAGKNDGAGSNAGHVRVYEFLKSPTPSPSTAPTAPTSVPTSLQLGWSQLGQDIDGEFCYDFSGANGVSISNDGQIIAIGAEANDRTGHVRVYKYDSTTETWSQLGADIDGEDYYDNFGRSVSLSGDGQRVAIGAAGDEPSELVDL